MHTDLLDALKTAALEAIQEIWVVYALVNETRKEIYFGTSKRPKERIVDEHSKGQTKAISHWDWSREKIFAHIMNEKQTMYQASKSAHWFENLFQNNSFGYRVHQTKGI